MPQTNGVQEATKGGTRGGGKKCPPAAQKKHKDVDRRDGSDDRVSLGLQQRCLNIFSDALKPEDDDSALVQEVKGHLYNRDFSTAFGKEEYLRVYASRWSPSRTLGYLQVFQDLEEHLLPLLDDDVAHGYKGLEVVCWGGGAGAELIALAGWASSKDEIASDEPTLVSCIDIAPWHGIVEALLHGINQPPLLSKYASVAAKESNTALLPSQAFNARFHQSDLLAGKDDLAEAGVTTRTKLATIMFTLNELYSSSMAHTQKLLSQLTDATSPGTLLLVVDSPGSYSSVALNGHEKKYPMRWLLDVALLGPPPKTGTVQPAVKWEKLVGDESRWFRLPQELKYPIELENMRYQIHLYRRLSETFVGD